MPEVRHDQQRLISEDLFGLGLRDAVLARFAGISLVPLESGYRAKINHGCILTSYTMLFNGMRRASLPARHPGSVTRLPLTPRIEAARAAALEVLRVAGNYNQVMMLAGGGNQAVNDRQRLPTN